MVAAARECSLPAGLAFVDQAPVVASHPNRVDVALFVGYVLERPGPLPAPVTDWLQERGWDEVVAKRTKDLDQSGRDHNRLWDVPVPIETWDSFDQLFHWQVRPVVAATLLGAAVRSFFAQGGRKCYVVRVGDPDLLNAVPLDPSQRQGYLQERVSRLIPGYPFGIDASSEDPEQWRGMTHLLGLSDVSFVCLPDLAEAVQAPIADPGLAYQPPPPPSTFVECSAEEERAVGETPPPRGMAPRSDVDGYQAWAWAVNLVAAFVARHCREVQLLAAVPLPVAGSPPEASLLGYLVEGEGRSLALSIDADRKGLATAFVQLCYPWLRTSAADLLPEGLESPDGVLAGVLARNALMQGTYRSAANLRLPDLYDRHPSLSQEELLAPVPRGLEGPVPSPGSRGRPPSAYRLPERVTLFSPTPDGWKLLSDVTTSADEAYRPACVSRLIASIVRAARRLGEEVTFEASGEELWLRLRLNLNDLLFGLYRAGALRGNTPAEAFSVRCDRSTMTQNDIDAGRVIAVIQIQPAVPVERIEVVIALSEGGQAAAQAASAPRAEG